LICSGCQPNRTDSRGPIGAKHRPSPTHHCSHNGCFCDLCNPQYAWRPLSKDEWEESVHALEALGSFYIDNTKILIEMVKQKKLKPNMKPKEKA
jgi:hypothetical protein